MGNVTLRRNVDDGDVVKLVEFDMTSQSENVTASEVDSESSWRYDRYPDVARSGGRRGAPGRRRVSSDSTNHPCRGTSVT